MSFFDVKLLGSAFDLSSYSDFRMVVEEIALPTANPEPCMKVSLHTALQCMVIGY